jgi:hypothetical protein
MNARATIDLDRDLPPRARALTASETSQVFGGCTTSGACRKTDQWVCCPPVECNRQPNGTYRCSTSASM